MEPHASQLCHAAHELSLQPEAEKIRVKWKEVCRFVAAATSSRMAHHVLSADVDSDAMYKGSLLANKEKKAPSMLPVCRQIGKGIVLDRPTQGRTVEVCNTPALEAK